MHNQAPQRVQCHAPPARATATATTAADANVTATAFADAVKQRPSMHWKPVTRDEIVDVIKSVHTDRAPGPSSTPSPLIRYGQTPEPLSQPSQVYSPTLPPYLPPTPASEKKVPFINLTEPILDARFQRLATYPIDPAYADLWNMYKRHVASFWTPEEVDLSQDKDHYARLDSNAQFFLSSTPGMGSSTKT
jgi:hypothetical protein